jgi:hypothetical protein
MNLEPAIQTFSLSAVREPKPWRRAYELWMRFATRLAKIQTWIILSVVYFLVITPIGLVLRLFRPGREFDSGISSYRVTSASRGRETMRRPY